MKKTLIATGAASLALAAMPVVGVFAADPASVVDTVRVIIDESCTFEATQNGQTIQPTAGTPPTISRAFEKHATLGEVVTLGGTGNEGVTNPSTNAITVAATCNFDTPSGSSSAGTWQIKAASSVTMAGSGSNSIPNSTSATTELTSGGTSAWSMKIVAPTTGIQNGYGSYHVMPSATGDVVVTGTTSTSTDVTFTPEYRVYVGTDQAADTYVGTVTYTIASPAD